MDGADVAAISRAALWVVFVISAPMLAVALVVGVVIGLLQALTQVQEMTLTFVPKLIAMGVALLLSLPLIGDALGNFTRELTDRVAQPVAAAAPALPRPPRAPTAGVTPP